MNPTDTQFYRASQIGQALGRTRQAMRRALAQSPPDGQVTVSGHAAQAWSFAALPVAIQNALETAAQTAGYRDAFHLLSASGRKEETAKDNALHPKPEAPARIISLASEVEFQNLREKIACYEESTQPAINKRGLLWEDSFRAYEQKIDEGKAPKKLKRRLIEFLARNAPLLVHDESVLPLDALYKNFHRKYAAWVKGGRKLTSILDKRPENSGRYRAPDLTEDEKKLLTAGAAKLGGGIDQAWQILRSKVSPEIQSYYHSSFTCPARIRRVIRHDVPLAKTSLKGTHAEKTDGAYINRDPDGIASGDWDQSDDMTMVNMWWDDAPDTAEGFWFGQGQLIAWIDERSWFVYSWDLISDPFYDAFCVRNSWTVKAETWGLQRQGFSLERGLWKTSKLLVGSGGSNVDPLETEMGLRRLGLRFGHATHARVKVIERIYGKLQNYFQAAPGYTGRNPFTDCQQRTKEQIALVKSGKAHPSEFFLHKRQWKTILDKVCLHYNESPMHGKYHKGSSPKQVFEDCFTSKLVQVPPEYRYLLASNKIERPVTGNGISLRFGKQTFNYKSYELGRMRGQRVVAWFSPERPETICCTDLAGKNPFIVEREQRVYNHDPLPGTLEKAQTQNAAQNRYQKELHRSLKPYYSGGIFDHLFRPCIVDADAVEAASEFARKRAEYDAVAGEVKGLETRARKAAGKIGMALPPGRRIGRGNVESLERLEELLADDPQTETKGTP